jgi:PTS system nitrogen regulatory IIA component
MTLAEILDPARIVVADHPVAAREDVLRLVADLLAGPGAQSPVPADTIYAALLERETLATTAVGDGVAFPHAKLPGLDAARAAVAILPEPGADLGAADKHPVRLIVALVVPPDSVGEHLKMLGVFSRRLRDPQTRREILAARGAAAVLRLVGGIDVVSR